MVVQGAVVAGETGVVATVDTCVAPPHCGWPSLYSEHSSDAVVVTGEAGVLDSTITDETAGPDETAETAVDVYPAGVGAGVTVDGQAVMMAGLVGT